jgi:sugar diacid utilization regulator
MLEQLKAYYKDALLINERTENMDDYEWFYTKQGDQIGVLKQALTDREKQLLSIFLTPIPRNNGFLTKEEIAWHRFFTQGDDTQLRLLSHHAPYYRFIQFQIKQETVDKDHFHEAMQGLFREKVVIIWEQENRGIIIEKKREETEHRLPFEEMIDTLSSDFYITLHVFIGQTYPYDANLYHCFCLEKQYFQLAQTYIPTQTVYTMEDVLPILLIHHHPEIETIQKTLPFMNTIDKDLLETVKVFLQCNLNVSLAAKKLYMHRNSLQYRIDKFIEKTGIDIKHFKGAAAIYLAILINEYTKR